jgi:hypothetical protein
VLCLALAATAEVRSPLGSEEGVADLEARTSGAEAAVSRIFFTPRDQWRNRFQLIREVELSDQVNLVLDANVLDLQERLFERHRRVEPVSLAGWERKSVANARLNLGILDDRIKITSRYGWSVSEPHPTMAAGFGSAFEDGAAWESERGPALREDTGHALMQGLEASLLRSDSVGVTAFASYRSISPTFSAASGVNGKRKGLFSGHGKHLEYGSKVRFGPIELDLSRRASQRWVGSEVEELGPMHRTLRAAATLSLEGLRFRTTNHLGETAGKLVPASIWMSVAEGEVEPADDRSVSDGTRDLAFGMSWADGAWSADVSYWQSLYDGRQPGAEGADWRGQGFQVGYGYYAPRWGVYARGGLYRSANEEFYSRYEDSSLNGSLTFMLYQERFPDLTTSISYGDYRSDYLAWSTEMAYQGLSFTTSLDFTKYLPRYTENENPTQLLLGYRCNLTKFQYTSLGATAGDDHAVLLLFRTPF